MLANVMQKWMNILDSGWGCHRGGAGGVGGEAGERRSDVARLAEPAPEPHLPWPLRWPVPQPRSPIRLGTLFTHLFRNAFI